jgi:hypothetical protein
VGSFSSEQMKRVVEAAEGTIRNRGRTLERKVLQAASMGYQKGVAAGRAHSTSNNEADRREVEALRRELEEVRSERGGGSTVGYDDAASTFSDGTTRNGGGGGGGGSVGGHGGRGGGVIGIPEGVAAAAAAEDCGRTTNGSQAPSTPDLDPTARRGPPSSAAGSPGGGSSRPGGGGAGGASSARGGKGGGGNSSHLRVSPLMPHDAGRMPSEVSLGSSVGGGGHGVRRGEGGGAPTAALWALSVSAKEGFLPSTAAAASELDLISSRCQLYFAHEKLARAALGWATSRWRLACQEPRRRRLEAGAMARRRAMRRVARCFAAWAGTEDPGPAAAGAGASPVFASEAAAAAAAGPPPPPPPPPSRKTAASLVTEAASLREENARLSDQLARLKDEIESNGPTAREAAQSERFRLHLQRLQRDLEAARKERDAVKMLAGRAEREEEQRAGARRQSLRSQATQVGGSGDLAVGADDTAGMVQYELQAQAAKFHGEFERQARIAEAATEKLRNEASLRTRLEDQHRREVARLREMHTSKLASLRSEFALRGRIAAGQSLASRSQAGGGGGGGSQYGGGGSQFGGSQHGGDGEGSRAGGGGHFLASTVGDDLASPGVPPHVIARVVRERNELVVAAAFEATAVRIENGGGGSCGTEGEDGLSPAAMLAVQARARPPRSPGRASSPGQGESSGSSSFISPPEGMKPAVAAAQPADPAELAPPVSPVSPPPPPPPSSPPRPAAAPAPAPVASSPITSPQRPMLTAAEIAKLEIEAGRIRRHGDTVEEKIMGWEVTAGIAEGGGGGDGGGGGGGVIAGGGGAGAGGGGFEPPRRAPSEAGSSRRAPSETGSTRSRPGTAAAVAAAVKAGGVSAVDALLARGGEFDLDAVHQQYPRQQQQPQQHPQLGKTVRPPSARVTMAVAQLVMRGHGREEATAALGAVRDNDVDAAHNWLMQRGAEEQLIGNNNT